MGVTNQRLVQLETHASRRSPPLTLPGGPGPRIESIWQAEKESHDMIPNDTLLCL